MTYGIAENKEKIEVLETSEFLKVKSTLVEKSKFAVVTSGKVNVSFPYPDSPERRFYSTNITFPSSFTKDNCVIISAAHKAAELSDSFYTWSTVPGTYAFSNYAVGYSDTGVDIKLEGNRNMPAEFMFFRVVLMRID